jgi:hypothetical protein
MKLKNTLLLCLVIVVPSCGWPVTASLTYVFPDSGAKAGLSVSIPKAVQPTK